MITLIVVKVERYGFTLPESIQKGGDGIANSVDPDQTAPRSSLFWVCTVCSDLSVPIDSGVDNPPEYAKKRRRNCFI